MKQVPYIGNPGNACALACYTMVAQYLLPEENITFERLGKIANWHKGYVVWAFPVWQWMMGYGIKIHDQDISNRDAWAKSGIKGLKDFVTEKEFKFYEENSYNLEKATEDLRKMSDNPNFTYTQKKVAWDDIVVEVAKPGICDLTLDGRKLHRAEGFTVHRVVLIEITDAEVVFHDPLLDNSGAYKREPIEHFRAAVESLSGPEICRYYLRK